MFRITSCLFIAVALAGCGSNDDSPSTPAMDLTILHINDHHSNLASADRDLKLNTGTTDRTDIEVSAAGFARVAQAMQELQAKSANVIKIHAGDMMTGTLFFNRAGEAGEADAAMMNTVCFDSITLGNHEFDKGDATLKSLLDRLKGGGCAPRILSANVHFGAASALHPSRASGYVQPSAIIERNGQKIGLVGLTIAGKTRESSSPDPDTRFEDEYTAAQREIDALRAQGVNRIILQSHVGYEQDKTLIGRLRGVDVVVGGDSHTLLGPDAMKAFDIGSPAGPYPTVLRNADGDRVCLVHAWEYARVVGELKVRFDDQGVVTECSGTPHVLIGNDFRKSEGDALNATELAAVQADVSASGFLRITAEHAAAAQTLQPFANALQAFSAQEVAVVRDEICSRRVPGGPGSTDYSRSSETCNQLGEVSRRGGDIQQMAAQAYLEIARREYGGADISLQSGGGARIPLRPGRATAADVITVLPFANMLYRLDITGAEVKGMVEDGLHAVFRQNGSTGPYPYTGGLRFDVDAGKPRGERASNLEVHDPATGRWEALYPARTYKLAVLSFNAEGGDGYDTLKNVPASRVMDIGVLDSDVFLEYIRAQPVDAETGLPTLRKLPDALYSTKSFREPGGQPAPSATN
ncbi:MAG: 5'-nucleotidase C-terminal domain-containing protein [Lautropia sp.]|nr:5'-nucleotidase C-terminal domain-containing protein [Lautropia sp.]